MEKPVILVTGSGAGIGRECVLHLAKAGAIVVATARRRDSVQDLAEPGAIEPAQLDVTDDAQRAAAIEDVLSRFGRIDGLVNNAGQGAYLTVEDTPTPHLRSMFELNLFAAHDLARRVLPTMRQQGHGRIVNVASVAGHVAVPMMGAYCATKFAMRALTQAMDVEVRPFGVRALLVEPGWIRTQFGPHAWAASLQPEEQEASPYRAAYVRWRKRRGRKGGALPAAVARAVVRCCLDQNPSLRNFVPHSAKWMNLGKRTLPDALVAWGFRQYLR